MSLNYIKPSNIYRPVGFLPWLVWPMVLDYYHAPSWVLPAIFTVFGLVVIGNTVRMWKGTSVDVLTPRTP